MMSFFFARFTKKKCVFDVLIKLIKYSIKYLRKKEKKTVDLLIATVGFEKLSMK